MGRRGCSPPARRDTLHPERRSLLRATTFGTPSDDHPTLRAILPTTPTPRHDEATARTRRTYDHRLRDLVRDTGDVTIATKLGVPRSTAAGWLRREDGKVVTAEPLSAREKELRAEVVRLRRRVRAFRAVVRLLVALMRALGVELDWQRLPDGEAKFGFFRAIDRVPPNLALRRILRILGLSPSRYHAWRRAELRCELADVASFPSSSPHRLARDEIQRMREMVESADNRHVAIGTLAILA